MAEKKTNTEEIVQKTETQNRVPIFIPLIESDSGIVDQHVEIVVNGNITVIKRGEHVSVPFEVYEVLRNSGRFQNI